ncbi:39S ribosomal protein L47, mitochondrial [Neodiprion lecontei]|uniref:Large ribosomal subunit protein uL29m n=1 Tax=Neodiprion lecontei TaxID=441921 RepID=A0A6J0BP38_NEOLC|nr:39S ribosomal protein L47, mitochondrial [Neodiprion lecontei]
MFVIVFSRGTANGAKMASLAKVVNISRAINNVSQLFTNLTISPSIKCTSVLVSQLRVPRYGCAYVHTTPRRRALMEFFDDAKNWGEFDIKVGRAWRKDELRIKSNEDLHKLWFVLLKERNMLLTMEHAAKKDLEIFPNPERKYKVEESMSNLETVVRERNKAYHLLETGEDGERPGKLVHNQLGMMYYYRMCEHTIPKFMNNKWRQKYKFGYSGNAVHKFRKLYREKLWNEKRKARNRDRNHVMHLMKRFPNLDLEAVKEQYPDVDIENLKSQKKARGHFVPQ